MTYSLLERESSLRIPSHSWRESAFVSSITAMICCTVVNAGTSIIVQNADNKPSSRKNERLLDVATTSKRLF